jgi:hypothetical protein
MANKCPIHPGTVATKYNVALKEYFCEKCEKQIADAQAANRLLNKQQACYAFRVLCDLQEFHNRMDANYRNRMRPLGCPSVGNQERGSMRCYKGFAIRVPDLILGLPEIAIDHVRVNDIWATATHCGLVIDIKQEEEAPKITIRHCSSGQGKVADNDFATFFHGGGKFYRFGA